MADPNQAKRRVVITGMGVISPVGSGLEKFWDALLAGKSGIGPLTRFDCTNFKAKIAGEVDDFNPDDYIHPKEQTRLDRFVHYAIGASEMAVKAAGFNEGDYAPEAMGVMIGSGIGGLETIGKQSDIMREKGPRRVSPFLIPMLIINMAPGVVSMKHNFKGPNSAVATACASGTHAIGDAMKIIQRGDAEVMLAGGAEAAITELGYAGFCNMKALSFNNDNPEKASRPFDQGRDGFVMGEGAGVVVLETLEGALKRGATIYAELIGYGMTGDAHHMTAPAPGGEGAARAMAACLADAGMEPDDLDYINAHGTSTPHNDRCESQAINTVFGSHAAKLKISSIKSMTGHLLGAAGGVEVIASAMTLKEGIAPPTINYETPDPDCNLDYIPNEAEEINPRTAMSNSFGFGGHNATLALRKYEG